MAGYIAAVVSFSTENYYGCRGSVDQLYKNPTGFDAVA